MRVTNGRRTARPCLTFHGGSRYLYSTPMTAVTVLLISAAPREQAEVRAALEAIHGQPYRLEVVD